MEGVGKRTEGKGTGRKKQGREERGLAQRSKGGGTDNPEKAYNYNRHAVRCLLSGPSRNSAAAFESIC